MILIEKGEGIDNIVRVERCLHLKGENNYEELRRTSVSAIYINNYQSIDKFDFRSSSCYTITINSNLYYEVFGEIPISLIRDFKLNSILDGQG